VEITDRTVQARFLLVPSPELNEILLGVLGRAQRLYNVRICGFVALSNHIHILARVDDALQLSMFMNYFASNLAREISRLTGWTDKIWARRYQAIVISEEEAAQIARLEYLLGHGVKENLVEQVREWPGAHCVRNLLDGEPIVGTWFDRTKEYSARNRGKTISPRQFATQEPVTLSPLPCWDDLSPEQVRERVDAIVQRIEGTAAKLREETGTAVLGIAAVLAQKLSIARPNRRSPLRRLAMRSPTMSAVRSTRHTTCSWLPFEMPPRSCATATATRDSRWEVFRRRCLSSVPWLLP
jgi:REP element-mobilizing transposase RayT